MASVPLPRHGSFGLVLVVGFCFYALLVLVLRLPLLPPNRKHNHSYARRVIKRASRKWGDRLGLYEAG